MGAEGEADAQARLRREVARRRTFAIISHPDAGKTTLTEQLLLRAGAIETAGMVRASKASRATTSDWLAVERERGISVTSSAMQVPYGDALLTILDTPGHDDFAEDTFRALMAVDSAVMVIDAAKGVEAQTRELFAVCRRRGIPLLTFVNKLDLPALEPLEVVAHVEEALGIAAAPMSWPVGSGRGLRGVVDLATDELVVFERTDQAAAAAGVGLRTFRRVPRRGAEAGALLGPAAVEQLAGELELLAGAGDGFDPAAFARGALTPVYFGAALGGFGVGEFFDAFVGLAPPPPPRLALGPAAPGAEARGTVEVDPLDPAFSAFVFKLQANMNPRHRDAVAFLRVCSGRFEVGMPVRHHRLGKTIRLTRPYATLARERTEVEEAFPGDVLAIVNPGTFAIGDTVSTAGGFDFPPLPQLPPKLLGAIRPRDAGGRKAFDRGLEHLVLEGTVLGLELLPSRERRVAAVGRLQLEVLQHRLRQEYGVETTLEVEPYARSAWFRGPPAALRHTASAVAVDPRGNQLAFFQTAFDLRCAERLEEVTLLEGPDAAR